MQTQSQYIESTREYTMSKDVTAINSSSSPSLLLKDITLPTVMSLRNDDKLFAKFININRGFIENIVNKFVRPCNDEWEDYYQIGLIAMYKAIKSFKNGYSKLSTFAHHCITNSILQVVNKENRIRRHEVSFEEFTISSINSGESSKYSEITIRGEKINNSFEDSILDDIELEQFMSKLEPLHYKIVYRRYILGMKNKDVALDLGLNIHTYKHILRYGVIPYIRKLKKNIHQYEIPEEHFWKFPIPLEASRTSRIWTDKEVKILQKYGKSMMSNELKNRYLPNRSINAIKMKLSVLGIKKTAATRTRIAKIVHQRNRRKQAVTE